MTTWAAGGLGRGGFWALMAGLALAGCGTKQDETGAQNESGRAPPAGGSAGFVPVSRLQPTESGAWVADPNDPLTLYALGVRSMRSRDGGHTWAELAWPSDAQSLWFSRVPAPALYLQAHDAAETGGEKLLKSLDGGETWKKVGPGASGSAVLVDGDSGPVLVSYTDQLISRSSDNGSTWVDSVLPPRSDLIPPSFGRALVSTDAKPIVYVEASGLTSDSAGFQALVMVSTDAGATFVAKPVPAGPSAASYFPPRLSLDCRGRLYVLVGNTVYRSDDAGTTWQGVVTLEADVYNFEVMQGVAKACSASVYGFGDRPQGWYLWHLDAAGGVDSRPLPDGGPAADLGDDRLLLASTYAPLRQRSDDGGRSWWTAGVDLEEGDLAVSPVRVGLLFVSTVRSVLRSDDAGQTWQSSKATRDFVSNPYPDPHDASVLYARSVSGEDSPWSFISTDGGASLQNWPVPTLENPQSPQAIASSSTGRVTVVTDHGVYTTDDAGENFAQLKILPASQEILWAAIGASEPPSIYMYVATSDSPANEILSSLDGGVTWASGNPGMYATGLVAHPSDPEVAFALPGSGSPGLLRTLDGGKTWSQLAAPGGEGVTLRVAASPPYDLYALGRHLYRSSDEGDTWQLIGDAPPNTYDFQIDPHSGSARYILGASGLLYKMVE